MDPILDLDDELVACFLDESAESLQHLAGYLAEYHEDPGESEPIDRVFRAVHSIKGNSGYFGMSSINRFSHSLECTLDALRKGHLRPSEDLNRALIEGFDLLESMLESLAEGASAAEMPPAAKSLLDRLDDLAADGRTAEFEAVSDKGDREVVEATARPDEASSAPDPSAAASLASPASKPPASGRAAGKTVRIKHWQLDAFVEDVARLFVTSEQYKELQSQLDTALGREPLAREFRALTTTFASQIGSLEQRMAALRRVPIRPLLAKNARLARDLAIRLEKEINVHLFGEETEIDKTLLEDLDAPLMHIVRNAVDHGIGSAEDRCARQLEEAGNLWLKAELTTTHVVITVQDDGRGIDPARIGQTALERGVASRPELAAMSEEKVVELIFHPGLSTADEVTDISGRGVGLDVVRTNVRKHGGDVKVESRIGAGTIFRIEVPVRRMVVMIDALLVEHAGAVFAVPFKHIDRIIECEAGELKQVQGSTVVADRARCVPAFPLGFLLRQQGTPAAEARKVSGVLVTSGEDAMCILVDRVRGRKKIVVDDVHGLVEGAESVAGVAKLGGERLALVLNVPGLLATRSKKLAAAAAHPNALHTHLCASRVDRSVGVRPGHGA